MTDKKQAWTKEPWWVRDPDYCKSFPLVMCGRVGDDYVSNEVAEVNEAEDAARVVDCVNTLAGIPHPAEWRRLVDKAIEARRRWKERVEPGMRMVFTNEYEQALDALLALQSTTAEEKNDG